MTNFINRLRDGENIVLWIGDILGKLMGYPSKRDLAKLVYNDLDKYSKLEVSDVNSLADVCQVYLDSVTGSKLKLLNKLKNSYSNSKETSDLFYLFPKSPFISAVVTTNFDNLIENSYGPDIQKMDVQGECEIGTSLPRLYKINGDFEHLDKMLVTKQDLRKLKLLSLYNPLFENLKCELKDRILLFIGYDLEDPDTRDILSLIYKKLGDSKPNAYFVTSSSIINTETINWLNSNEIKLLKQNEIEFLTELKTYLIDKKHIPYTDDKPKGLSIKKKLQVIADDEIPKPFDLEKEPRQPKVKKIIIGENFEGKVKTYFEMQSEFVQNLQLPISRSNIPEFTRKEKITTIGKVNVTCGDSTLLNFTLKFLKSNGVNYFEIKNRECKIIFEGKVSKDNKIITTDRYLAYSISESLPIKRSLEVCDFFLNLFSGERLEFNIGYLSASLTMKNKIEKFKIEKILDVLNKYSFICSEAKVTPNEKFSKILKKSYEVDIIFHTILGKPLDSKIDIDIKNEDFIEGDTVIIVRSFKTNLKGLKFNILETISLEDTVTKSELEGSGVYGFGKKTKIIFKKDLDFFASS